MTWWALCHSIFLPPLIKILQSACKLKLTGIKDELKHVDKELKKVAPELRKVCWYLKWILFFCWSQTIVTISIQQSIREDSGTGIGSVYGGGRNICDILSSDQSFQYSWIRGKAAQGCSARERSSIAVWHSDCSFDSPVSAPWQWRLCYPSHEFGKVRLRARSAECYYRTACQAGVYDRRRAGNFS